MRPRGFATVVAALVLGGVVPAAAADGPASRLAPAGPGRSLIFDNAPPLDLRARVEPPPPPVTLPGLLSPVVESSGPRPAGLAAPSTAKALVLGVRFTDVAGPSSVTRDSVTAMVFGAAGSVKSFYAENSYGTFTLTGAVLGPTGTELWFDSGRELSWWGTDGPGCAARSLDGANGCVYDLVRTLVRAADPVVNFADYDLNADGFVDNLLVVQAGNAQEQHTSTTSLIWSHRWAILSARPGQPMTGCPVYGGTVGEFADGVCAFGYTLQSAESPMGTWAHEFGHALGLPDLYDTDRFNDPGFVASEGVGEWDVMGSGSYLGSPLGSSPAHLSAHSKMRMGWLTPAVASSGSWSLRAAESFPDALKVPSFAAEAEYFLVENRQQASLRGKGLLVWHVDDERYDARLFSNTVNADRTHKGLDLEEADESLSHPSDLDNHVNRSDAYDPFYAGNPAAGYEAAFGPGTTPNSLPYTGPQSTSVTLNTFSASGATMSLVVTFGDVTAPTTTASPAGTAGDAGWFRSSCVTVSLSADDAGGSGVLSTTYERDGGATTGYAGPFPVCGDGAHTVTFRSRDVAGNVEVTRSVAFSIDATSPSVGASSACPAGAPAGWCRGPVTVTFTVSDATSGIASKTCTVDGGAPTTYTSPFIVSAQGTRTVVCSAKDVAGNTASTAPLTVKVDSLSPSASSSLAGTLGDGWYRSPVTVTLSASDPTPGSGLASTRYQLNAAPEATYASPFTVSAQGEHTVTFTARDVAMNVSPTGSTSFRIDTTPPTVHVDDPGGRPLALMVGPRTVAVTATDALSGIARVRFLVDDVERSVVTAPASGSTYTWRWEPALSETGFRVLKVIAEDRAGLKAEDMVSVLVVG